MCKYGVLVCVQVMCVFCTRCRITAICWIGIILFVSPGYYFPEIWLVHRKLVEILTTKSVFSDRCLPCKQPLIRWNITIAAIIQARMWSSRPFWEEHWLICRHLLSSVMRAPIKAILQIIHIYILYIYILYIYAYVCIYVCSNIKYSTMSIAR